MPVPARLGVSPALRRVLLVPLGFLLTLLSCGREVTGPAFGQLAHAISFVATFPGPLASVAEGAGSVVPFNRVRVRLVRTSGAVAIDQTVTFAAGADSVLLDLRVPISSTAPATGEPLDLSLAYLNAAGDTVFRGGPIRVVAVAPGRGEPPPAAPVQLEYVGPGRSAIGVSIAPETLTVVAGSPFLFTAIARDAQLAPVDSAPFVFTSLDPVRAPIGDVGVGGGVAGNARGTALVEVRLAAGSDPDTGVLVVTPRPASLSVLSGGAQSAPAGALLSDSVRVRLLATDGGGIAGVAIGVAVTTGGGSVSAASLVTDATGRAAFTWTLGGTIGAQSVTLSSASVPNVTVGATAGDPPSVATQLAITQAPAAVQVIGQGLTPALRVEARDAAGVRVPGFTDSVTIAFGVNPSGATLGGTTRVAAIAGVATFTGVSVSALGTGYTLVASASGLSSATSAAFDVGSGGPAALAVVTGDAQSGFISQALAAPIVVRVTDALALPVEGATVTFAVTSGGGALTGASVLTNAAGNATLGSWMLGATPGANSITATVAGVPAVTITATGVLPPPTIELSVFGSNVVGIARAGTLNVRLLQPAPAGGLTVSVVSNDPSLLTIAAPGTVDFTSGQTLRTIQVSGIALGNAVVVATGSGYAPDTLVVPVSLNLISLPPTLNVPLAQSRSLPVQLSSPAPAGGVAVAVSSSNPAAARPATDTVFIAAGASSVNATIDGVGLGQATLTATNPNYALDATTVSVTAELNVVATSVSLNGTFGAPITVRLESGGSPVAAPAGGVPITLTPVDPTCASVAPTSQIDAGFVSVALNVTYGGSANLPCSTRIRVAGPAGFAVDSVTANVAVAPGINRAASSIGSGLQRSIGASLGATNHGGVTVRVTSLDSSLVFVAPDAATAGRGSYETVILPNASSIPLVISSVAGRIADTVSVRIEAPGFITNTFSVYVWQPVFQLTGLNGTASTLAVDDPFYVVVGTPSSFGGTSIFNADDVRRGGGPLTASIINDTPGIGTLVRTAGTADSVDVAIAEGLNNAPTSVATGGVAFRALSPGVASIRSRIAGLRALAAATGTVTVSQPAITLGTDYVGSGLQRARTVSTPGSPAPVGGTRITLSAARLGVVQFAPNATTPGVDTLDVVIAAGATSATFYVQGADAIVADTVVITATSPGFTTATAEQRVWRAVYQLSGLSASGTPLSADDAFYVSIGTPSSPTGTSIWVGDDRRAGGAPLLASIVVGTPSVGTLITLAGPPADSIAVPIGPGLSNSPTSVAAGGSALRYLSAGTTTVSVVIPGAGLRALAGATGNVTVNNTAITLATDYVGSGLQRSRSVSLTAAAPAGGVPVTIAADRLGVVQFAPNATSIGVDTLVVTIPQGSTSASFFVQGVEGITADTVTLSATSPGYASASAEQRVWRGVLEFSGLPGTLNTLAPDDPFQVIVGTPSGPTGTSIWIGDNIRFGAPPLVATIVSSTSTVGQLNTTARLGDTVTVQLAAGGRISPATVAAGGVAFQSLTTGTTIISAAIPNFVASASAAGTTVTITAPALSLNTPASIGSGLQVGASGSVNAAQHGGINVVVRSSNPALVRVAPSATVAATDSIVIPLANGVTSFSYVVAAEDVVTGQASLSASAVGFTDATTTATVVTPMIQLAGVATSPVAGAADDVFQVQIGVPVANLTTLSALQARRAGAPPLVTTVSSSNAAVGTLVMTGITDDTVSVSILPGSNASPTSVAAGGVAHRALSPGATTLRVTHPVVASTTASGTASVTVGQPTVTLSAIATVGAGLQVGATGSVNAPQHGGISIVIRSANPAVARVALTGAEVATDSIVLALANGVTSFSYIVAGMENATGTPAVTATATGFISANQTATVVAPRFDINGLVATGTVNSLNDSFQVRIGIPNAGNTALASTQVVRAGAAPITVTVNSSAPTVGTLVTTALTAASVTVQIVAGASASPTTVALGGVAFDFLSAGTTIVTLSHPSILPVTTAGTVTVTVTP